MDLQALKDQRNKLLHDAQALLLKDTVSAEDLVSARKMSDDASALEERISLLGGIGGELTEENRAVAPPRSQPGSGNVDVDQGKQNRSKFERFIRYGERSDICRFSGHDRAEQRDLLTSAAAGAFVPQEFYPVLIEAKKAWGGILNELNMKPSDNGAPMKIPFSNDTGNLLTLDSEPSSMSELDPSLTAILLAVDNLKTDVVKVSLPELQDSFFDIDSFIRDQFGKRYYRGLTSLVTNGSWAGSPPAAQNIESITSAAVTGATSAASGAIAWADITALYGSLDPAYEIDAVFSMNSKTRAYLLGVTDTLGRPLYIPAPTAGSFDMILGKRVVLNQYLPDIATTNVAIQYGDFKQGYMLREVKPGLAIVRLNERYMDTLEVGFIGYCRAGGVGTNAGTNPIVNLVQR